MATKLEKPLKREIAIRDKPFVITIAPSGFMLVGKGRRKGLEISWEDLVGGAALATALRASLSAMLEPSARAFAANDGTRRLRGVSRKELLMADDKGT